MAIKMIAPGCDVVTVYPVPLDAERDEDGDVVQPATDQAIAAIGRSWERLGFAHYRHGVHILVAGLRLPGDQKISSASNVTITQNGTSVTAASLGCNGLDHARRQPVVRVPGHLGLRQRLTQRVLRERRALFLTGD
jgi:hypothetical protein